MVSYGLEGEFLNENNSFLRLGRRIPRIFLAFPAQTGQAVCCRNFARIYLLAHKFLEDYRGILGSERESSRIIGVSWARGTNYSIKIVVPNAGCSSYSIKIVVPNAGGTIG